MNVERLDAVFPKHLRLRAGSEPKRVVRAVNVGVDQASFVAKFCQRERQVHGKGGLADAPFARPNGDNGVNTRQGLRAWRGLSGTGRHVSAQEVTLEEESKLDYTGRTLGWTWLAYGRPTHPRRSVWGYTNSTAAGPPFIVRYSAS